jgi:hypothetical protein
MLDEHPFVINLPELSDEAVVALHDFLLDVLTRFESQYFAQIHRHYRDLEAECCEPRTPPPLENPPF